MGDSLSAIADKNEFNIECRLETNNGGKFAGLIPTCFETPAQGRDLALLFAQALVRKLGRGFCDDSFHLAKPGVPKGATDLGVHCSTHNSTWNGADLSPTQITAIENCTDTFTLTVNLKDFKVLVGSPSNDKDTGVIGYVGLLLSPKSLESYNKATKVYSGVQREETIPHITVCGWTIKGYASTTQAREAFGLITANGQLYKDGKKFYAKDHFPKENAKTQEDKTTKRKHELDTSPTQPEAKRSRTANA